jgi:acetyltransferase
MDCLLDYCRARRLERLSGLALADNVGMHRLARACGFQLLPALDGNVEMVLGLQG